MALASVALAHARTILNDDVAAVWTDAALLPKLQIAHQELQMALWEVGSPAVRKESSLISVSAGITPTDLSGSQPTDMLTPTKLYEFTSGGAYYGEMTETFYIPKDLPITGVITYWCWRKEKIFLWCASADRKVKIQYRKLITIPSTANSDLGLAFAELYCAPRAAALAAGSVGNAEILAIASDMATANFSKVVAANRGQQTPPNRP